MSLARSGRFESLRLLVVSCMVLLLASACGDAGGGDVDEASLAACTGLSLSAAPPGPSAPGTAVTLSAGGVSCGAAETPEYRFLVKQDGTPGAYQLLRDWAPAATAPWPTAGLPSGKYSLLAQTRAVGTSGAQASSYATYFLTDVCTSVTTSSSPASPQPPGTIVTLSALATCTGGAPAEYRFFYRPKGTGPYTALGPYSSSPSFDWDTTGLAAGPYNLLVYARRAGNTSGFEAVAHDNYSLGAVCSSASLTPAPPSPRPVGTSVTLSAAATCPGAAEYRFLTRSASSPSFTVLQAYSPSASATWNTAALAGGVWVLRVEVRSAGGSAPETAHEIGYTLTSPMSVATGSAHACVVVNGGVKCFGRALIGGPTGQYSLDRGIAATDMGDGLPAVNLGSGRTALAVARGGHHTCAILNGGQVKCWGSNGGGQLGQGDTLHRSAPFELGDSLAPVNLGTGRTAKAITAGSGHVCAILDNDAVKCWGSNSVGQLGLGDVASRGDQPGEMGDALPTVQLGTGRSAKSVAAGVIHTCAILDDDSVKCWGFNSFGVLGLGDRARRGDEPGEMGDALPTVQLGTGRTAKALALGNYETCALLDDDSVKCWGYNAWGQLGQGDTINRGDDPGEMGDALPPIALGTGRTTRQLASGGHHRCALLDDFTVKCWGYNANATLGVGDRAHRGDQPGEMGDALPAVALGTGRSARSVVATFANSCAELDTGAFKCWGASTYGVLGIGPSDMRGDSPGDMGDALPSFDLGTGRRLVSFGSGLGNHFACGLLDDASLKCWGSNSFGQLGVDGSSNVGDEPADMGANLAYVDLGAGAQVVAVDGGESHTCALLADGRVKCWGSNRGGTLGYGDEMRRDGRPSYMGDSLPAVALGTGRTATALAVGAEHACAVLDDGSVKCWGVNEYGQLGLGDTLTRGDGPGEMGDALPSVSLGTGRTAVTIAAGLRHTCAVLDDGSLKCWGHGGFGILGLGDGATRGDQPGEMGDALPAVSLGTGRTALSVSCGVQNTCVLLDDSSVKCWGANGRGQLGQGDTTVRGNKAGQMGDALPAIALGTGRTARAVTVGDGHACALLDDDRIKCWGHNAFGKLGVGSTANLGDGPGEMGDALPYVNLGASAAVASIGAGDHHNCAALASGSVKCWGENSGGQLGLGDETNRGSSAGQMGSNLPAVALGAL